MGLVLQFLVLALTAALWWAARRDLALKAADARTPVVEDWARLHVTVEQLMVELERRAVVAEQRVYTAEQSLQQVEQRLQAALAHASDAQSVGAASGPSAAPVPGALSAVPTGEPAVPVQASIAVVDRGGPEAAVAPLSAAPPLTVAGPPPGTAIAGTTAPAPLADTAGRAIPFVEWEPSLPARASAPQDPPPVPQDPRYLPVYALADAGETDAAEIARRTRLPRGEVELVLSLRARRGA